MRLDGKNVLYLTHLLWNVGFRWWNWNLLNRLVLITHFVPIPIYIYFLKEKRVFVNYLGILWKLSIIGTVSLSCSHIEELRITEGNKLSVKWVYRVLYLIIENAENLNLCRCEWVLYMCRYIVMEMRRG